MSCLNILSNIYKQIRESWLWLADHHRQCSEPGSTLSFLDRSDKIRFKEEPLEVTDCFFHAQGSMKVPIPACLNVKGNAESKQMSRYGNQIHSMQLERSWRIKTFVWVLWYAVLHYCIPKSSRSLAEIDWYPDATPGPGYQKRIRMTTKDSSW